jgi:MFS family permease
LDSTTRDLALGSADASLGVAPDRATPKIVAMAATLTFLSGYNNFILGIALLQLHSVLNLTPAESGVVLAATSIGMLLGSVVLGRVADLIGRKRASIIDLGVVALAAIASAASVSAAQLVFWRLVLGVGLGGGYPISSSYVADIGPAATRGARLTLASSGWGVGVLASGFVGWLLLRAPAAALGWRTMLATGAIPAVVALIALALWRVPEAPAWVEAQSLQPLPLRTLFTRENWPRTLVMIVPWFLVDIPVYGVGLLTPTLLGQLHLGGLHAVILGYFVVAGFTLVGCLIPYLLIDPLGRRPLQIGGFLGTAVLMAWLALDGVTASWLCSLAVFVAIQLFINAGPNTTTWIVAAELFPTRLRATAQGAATSISRLGAISGTLLLPIVDARAGMPMVFGIAAAVSLLGAVLTWGWLPETARVPLEP